MQWCFYLHPTLFQARAEEPIYPEARASLRRSLGLELELNHYLRQRLLRQHANFFPTRGV